MARQIEFSLPEFSYGFHIITNLVTGQLGALPQAGMLHLFIKHTSAGLTINENADPTVLKDFTTFFSDWVPERYPKFLHTDEGPDDMPAHIKASVVGHSVNIPISNHRLNLGTWQGIYLCEFRYHGGRRKLIATIVE